MISIIINLIVFELKIKLIDFQKFSSLSDDGILKLSDDFIAFTVQINTLIE